MVTWPNEVLTQLRVELKGSKEGRRLRRLRHRNIEPGAFFHAMGGANYIGWRPSLVGWRPSLVGWRPSLVETKKEERR